MKMNTYLNDKTEQTLKKTAVILSTGIVLLMALFLAQPVFAAEIVVVGSTCTLADAITAANTNTATGGCPAGDDVGGYDTIDLQTDVVLTAELPHIMSTIVLEGNGRTLDGNDSFRVLEIHPPGELTLNNATLTRGNANVGAAIWAFNNASDLTGGAALTVNNSTLTGNNATHSGGAIRNGVNNTVIINNSTIANNTAVYGGGGLHTLNNTKTIINNSTFSGNDTTLGGGGIHITENSNLTVTLSTITQNSTGDFGGGLLIPFSTTAALNLSLISGNSAVDGPEIYSDGTVTAANYNVIGYGGSARSAGFTPSGTDIIPSGPLTFILDNNLKDNGGPTPTHTLKSNSAAKDAAPNAACSAAPADGQDQRGAARNIDLDGSGTANECDIGAHELHESVTVGICGPLGPQLSGPQIFDFSSGNSVSIDVKSANGLRCLTVEEMGPGANHLYAAQADVANLNLETNNWWHITSNNVSGFDVDVTLPYAAADGGSRVCKWLGGTGSVGWDCADAADTAHVENNSVTRQQVSSFSDWTVGAATCPTAVTPTASIELTGANNVDVLLNWDDDAANSGGYAVYRSQTPYFTPDAATLHTTLAAGSTSTVDNGAAGSASVNYFYIVRGLNSCGAASAYTQQLGAFDFGIVPGA